MPSLPSWFRKVHALLSPGGKAQAIGSVGVKDKLRVRRAEFGDLRGLVALEASSDPMDPTWGYRDFLDRLPSGGQQILLVAYRESGVVGYLALATFPEFNSVISLVVDPAHRRRGVATRLLKVAKELKGVRGRDYLVAFCREENLPFQLTLRASGFICDDYLPGYYEGPDGAALRFVYSHGGL